MKKKFLTFILCICFIIPAMFCLSACSNENKTDPQNFRVKDGWVQFTQDGETWINLIEAEYPISEYDFRIYNGYVQWTSDGETWINLIEVETKTYTVSYNYGAAKDLFEVNAPETSTVKENTWLMDLPKATYPYYNSFKGWFIEGTDKQITEYDYIAGDVTLQARFDFTSSSAPAGIYYKSGYFIRTWESLIENGDIVVENGVLISASNAVSGDLKIDKNVTSIGDEAFNYATALTGVMIPDRVKTIGKNAFSGLHNLTNITIPGNVVMIEEYAFQGCDNLTSVNLIERTQCTWKIYDDRGFILSEDVLSLTEKKLVSYLKNGYEFKQICWQNGFGLDYISVNSSRIVIAPVSDKTITEAVIVDYISIPVTEIDDFAFYDCNNLTNITIPDSIMEIGVDAFRSCDSLTAITFEEKEGYKWQVYDNNDWRDAQAGELFNLAKEGKQLKRVTE